MTHTTASISVEQCPDQATALDSVWLLEGLKSGDENAYEALIHRYQQPVYNLVYRLMDDPSDCNDVVQEVFLKVFRNVGTFRGNSSLKTWIYRIAVNEAYNQRRWFSRHRKKEIGLELEEEGAPNLQDVLCDPGRSAFDQVSSGEMRAHVEQALTEIPSVFRAAVILRDMEEMSYDEIADVLNVSLGTVKSRILRGRESLRKTLTTHLEGAPAPRWSPRTAE